MDYTQQILDMLADGRERYTSEIASKIGIPDATALRLLDEMCEGSLVICGRWHSEGREVSVWMLAKAKE